MANWYSMAVPLGDVDSKATNFLQRRYDMNGKSQMQGGKDWISLKDINKNRFFGDSEIWKNHLCPSMGPRRYDTYKSFQMQGGKNWILPK